MLHAMFMVHGLEMLTLYCPLPIQSTLTVRALSESQNTN